MALKYILDEVAAQLGVPISLAEDRTLWIDRINRAAQTSVYNKGDFEDLMDEEVLDFDVGEQQVTLPSYVGYLRGMRYYDLRLRQPVAHPGNRYGMGYGNEIYYLKAFREKTRSPLARLIENQTRLTFRLDLPETTNIVFTITGSTARSQRYIEPVTIVAGTLEAETIENYIKVESLRKNRITSYNIHVEDADGEELAEIPNSQYDSFYRVIQIQDTPWFSMSGSSLAIEIYYKKRFVPFLNDGDEFVGGPHFDHAILYKVLENHAGDLEKKIEFSTKFKEALKDFHEDSTAGKHRQVNFSKHPAIRPRYYDY